MSLYDTDFVAWTRQQSTLLRSMPDTHSLDIANLVDEIEGLGRTAIADLSIAIKQVLSGLIRRSVDPASANVEDIYLAQAEMIIRADAGVWKHVDVDKLWRLAKRLVDVELPERCPLSIEQLIADDFDVTRALSVLRS